MKKAVILSGELRSYKKCYNNFKNIFINDKSTDIFISVWKQVGRNKKCKNKNVRKHDRIIDDVDNENHIVTKEELVNMYKPKSIYLDDYKDEYKNELNNIKRPDDFFINKKKESTTMEIHRRHCEQLFYYRMITDNKEWVEVNNYEDFVNEKKLKKIKNHKIR